MRTMKATIALLLLLAACGSEDEGDSGPAIPDFDAEVFSECDYSDDQTAYFSVLHSVEDGRNAYLCRRVPEEVGFWPDARTLGEYGHPTASQFFGGHGYYFAAKPTGPHAAEIHSILEYDGTRHPATGRIRADGLLLFLENLDAPALDLLDPQPSWSFELEPGKWHMSVVDDFE